jgi:hypothetical protein
MLISFLISLFRFLSVRRYAASALKKNIFTICSSDLLFSQSPSLRTTQLIRYSKTDNLVYKSLPQMCTPRQDQKTYGREKVQLYAFLTSAQDGGDWPDSRPGRFSPGERSRLTHCIGGYVGPRASLDAVAKRKKSCLCRESNPGHPVHSRSHYWMRYASFKSEYSS